MIVDNTNITSRSKQLPLATLAKSLNLSKALKAEVNNSVESISIIGAIDKDIAKPSYGIDLIYLVQLVTKGNSVPTDFVTTFDKYTEAHTVWEILQGQQYSYRMSNKHIKDGKIVVDTYYTSKIDSQLRIEIAIGDTLGDIYANLYSQIVGLQRRKDESVDEIGARLRRIQQLQHNIDRLNRKKHSEIQFNKKSQINTQIRALLAQIEGEK
jgi:hypothetical protein